MNYQKVGGWRGGGALKSLFVYLRGRQRREQHIFTMIGVPSTGWCGEEEAVRMGNFQTVRGVSNKDAGGTIQKREAAA